MPEVIDPAIMSPLGGSTAKFITVTGINATAQNNIFGAVGSVFQVEIDATENSGEDVFLKFYDNATPTVGTDDEEMVLKGKAGEKTPYDFERGIPFITSISVACTIDKAGGTGTTGPTGTVNVQIHVGATP